MGMHKSASAQCEVSAFAKFACTSVYNCDLLPAQTRAGDVPPAILLAILFSVVDPFSVRSVIFLCVQVSKMPRGHWVSWNWS